MLFYGFEINPLSPVLIEIFIHLKLCLATATHNFKWMKITLMCTTQIKPDANLANVTCLMFISTYFYFYFTNKKFKKLKTALDGISTLV